MIKKFLLLGLVITQLITSCSNDNNDSSSDNLGDQIENLINKPYSQLTPAEQKVKLEAEANEMLIQLDKTKSTSAIETLENLERLLDISSVDIFNGKNDNQVEDIINVSGVYGIYTWNNTKNSWDKTASTNELKFVFPAKESQNSNNASLSAKSTSSDIKVEVYDSYDWTNDIDVNDYFYLPTSTNAILTIDNKEVATISQNAKYTNGKETPVEFGYKMSCDGYAWEISAKKAAENTSKATLTYNGKNLIEFNTGSTAQIDALIDASLDTDEISSYLGKANGLIKLMDNFIIVANMDLASAATDETSLENSLTYPNYPDYNNPNANFKAYFTAENTYNQKYSSGTVANFNKNMKLVLVSKKDGTKIADIVLHSEKEDYDYTFNLPVWDSQYQYWDWSNQGETFTSVYYTEVYYLKFNDNTEVEMSAYFSSGFEDFETKFKDFITAFEKK